LSPSHSKIRETTTFLVLRLKLWIPDHQLKIAFATTIMFLACSELQSLIPGFFVRSKQKLDADGGVDIGADDKTHYILIAAHARVP